MRGKLEQPKGLIELISVELERIDFEYGEFWLSYEYTCPGGEYKSAMAIPITNSKEMTNYFFKELLNEAKHLSAMDEDESNGIGLFIANKSDTMLPIKNLCQRVIEMQGIDEPLNESKEYIDLSTSGFHFKDSSQSLSDKDFEERFKIFMARAKEKMSQGYYTIAADDLEKTKILCSTSPLIYKLIGICHRELGHLDLALEMFESAMEFGDIEQETFLYLAEVSFFLNNMTHAEAILERMLEKYPDNIRALVELANVRYQLDKEYIDILDKASALDPEATGKNILQTFVFKKQSHRQIKPISIDQASRMMEMPVHTISLLAGRHRIPIRTSTDHDAIIFDEFELKSWALVYRRYNLLQDEIERVTANPGGDSTQGMALLP
ncbi:MAG: hypothetical protein JW920_06185 [Deltaproteobacteria bacterium]|nr:hypothetical protein [Deltaproteobacteria bacterium]